MSEEHSVRPGSGVQATRAHTAILSFYERTHPQVPFLLILFPMVSVTGTCRNSHLTDAQHPHP